MCHATTVRGSRRAQSLTITRGVQVYTAVMKMGNSSNNAAAYGRCPR
jgi:hypothetical protein